VTLRAPRADAIVIGAGIVGAACAEALVRDGWRVLILEEGFLGGGATGAAMGHLVAMDDSPAQLALTAYSLRLWRAVRPELPLDAEELSCGTLWIAEHEAQLHALAERRQTYAAAGVRSEIVDPLALAEAEPALRPGLAGALLVPDDSVVYPPAVARWLIGRACAHGAELREQVKVTRVESRTAVTTDGRYDADLVVIANGCQAPALVPELRIVPRKGHLVVTDRYPGFCAHQLVETGYLESAHDMDAASVAFNLQPRSTGQLLVGSSRELSGWDASLNRDIVRAMIARATYFVPALQRIHALRIWTGFRPATADGLPFIGAWPTLDGVWVAAGHEGLGITTALGTAQLLADLLAGRQPAIDVAPYAPDRQSHDVPHGVAHA
jgi:glycine/D-amino acid oxidase-like deaminating enzyme